MISDRLLIKFNRHLTYTPEPPFEKEVAPFISGNIGFQKMQIINKYPPKKHIFAD